MSAVAAIAETDERMPAGADTGTMAVEAVDQVHIPWKQDQLETYLRNQIKLAPVMPLIATFLCAAAALWASFGIVACWILGVIGSSVIQSYLCQMCYSQKSQQFSQRDLVGMIAAAEFLQAAFWIAPLFLFWPATNSSHGTYLVAAVMVVCALRFLIVNSFMPVLVAGTGMLSLGLALRCFAEFEIAYFGLGALVVVLEIFFLFVARHLQDTARDMFVFRSQKDILIEQLRRARDSAEEERRRAEAANAAKTSFLANMSHELRTPLNAILGFSEVLNQELFGPMTNNAYKNYAGDINSSGKYLLGLIDDILDVSRIETGRHHISEDVVDVKDALKHAQGLLELPSGRKKIQVSIEVDPQLPCLMADARAVRQIAINLANNAVKFTQPGGTVKLIAKRISSGDVQLSVSDNGPGIPADEVKTLLSAFSRGSYARRHAVDGAGLGLSIVKGIMELHGGSVNIASKEGVGTTVSCIFPARRVLSGPRSHLQSSLTGSETQRKLVNLTA